MKKVPEFIPQDTFPIVLHRRYWMLENFDAMHFFEVLHGVIKSSDIKKSGTFKLPDLFLIFQIESLHVAEASFFRHLI